MEQPESRTPKLDAADRRAAAALTEWFAGNARSLPWRTTPAGSRDPYIVLVSEVMLQQTQVSRVLERFPAFTARFPTVEALALAHQDEVLGAWSGMGYYRRAHNLHAAAKMIVGEFGGRWPREPREIRRLPGVGRYTAGAIASIAFGLGEPIVDGNVARVLLRVHGKDAASDDRAVQSWLWERALSLVRAAESPGVFNEAIMELGATVCTPPPAIPRCDKCPLRAACAARREGLQLEIPRPKTRAAKTTIYCAAVVVEREDGALLVEQRPSTGMWGGMWQAPTVESVEGPPSARVVAAALGLEARTLRPEATFEHQTTHRRMVFQVWRAGGGAPAGYSPRRGLWMSAAKIAELGMSTAQRRILLESGRGGTLWT